MKVYLDTSVLIALLTVDPHSPRAAAFLRTTKPEVVLSDFARAEYCAVIARQVRTGELSKLAARQAFSVLDLWAVSSTSQVETMAGDVRDTETIMRRLDVTLRAPDALNIAIAQRVGAHLATFDVKMAASARTLGVDLVSI